MKKTTKLDRIQTIKNTPAITPVSVWQCVNCYSELFQHVSNYEPSELGGVVYERQLVKCDECGQHSVRRIPMQDA